MTSASLGWGVPHFQTFKISKENMKATSITAIELLHHLQGKCEFPYTTEGHRKTQGSSTARSKGANGALSQQISSLPKGRHTSPPPWGKTSISPSKKLSYHPLRTLPTTRHSLQDFLSFLSCQYFNEGEKNVLERVV
jgi:hypothetical protein